MLTLALTRTASLRDETPQLFRKMGRAIKLMAGMQLVPEELARLLAPRRPRQVPVVFYTGCNAIRTPHLLFNTMAILGALAIDYEVMGGPGACCGIIHTKWEGEIETGGRVAESTLRQFAGATPEQVLNWCPSCHLHLTESLAEFHTAAFDINHVTDFIREQLDVLRTKFIRPVAKRVIVHAHTDYHHIGEIVTALIGAIPEIASASTPHSPWGCPRRSAALSGKIRPKRTAGLGPRYRLGTRKRAMHPRILPLAALLAGISLAAQAQPLPPQLTYVQPLSRSAVQAVQEHLRQAGDYAGRVDGIWGPDSVTALQRFQQAHGLQVTGQLNQATAATMNLNIEALLGAPPAAPQPAVSPAPLAPDQVRAVQARLRGFGFYRGGLDGIWGPRTQAAIARFQQSRGLEANSQLNPATLGALGFQTGVVPAG